MSYVRMGLFGAGVEKGDANATFCAENFFLLYKPQQKNKKGVKKSQLLHAEMHLERCWQQQPPFLGRAADLFPGQEISNGQKGGHAHAQEMQRLVRIVEMLSTDTGNAVSLYV